MAMCGLGCLSMLACGPEADTDDCTESDPTWNDWGAGFFASYCRPCHSESTPDRYGAPEGLDFDTWDQVRAAQAQIRGAVLDRETMPVGGGVPDIEKDRLDRFLSCGL
jgi:hypothetical protein